MTAEWPLDEASAPLDARDRARISRAESSLREGLALKRWWDKARAAQSSLGKNELLQEVRSGTLSHWFPLTRGMGGTPFCGENFSFGFFDEIRSEGPSALPVVGRSQRTFFDRPMTRHPGTGTPTRSRTNEAAERKEIIDYWHRQLERFALVYSLNAGNYQSCKAPYIDTRRRPLSRYLSVMSTFPSPVSAESTAKGFSHQKVYYKRRSNGRVGKFRRVDQPKIDLRSVEPNGEYEWLVIKIKIYETHLKLGPAGNDQPHIVVPFDSTRYAVLSREFICQEENPSPGLLGRYGHGYALLNDPAPGTSGSHGFQSLDFQIDSDGLILASTAFVTQSPNHTLPFPPQTARSLVRLVNLFSLGLLAPITRPLQATLHAMPKASAYEMAKGLLETTSTLTGGWSEEVLGLSVRQLQALHLMHDSIGFMNAMESVGHIWRLIPDWTRTVDLPEWIKP